MANSNIGDQTVTLSYGSSRSTSDINKYFEFISHVGIYEGGEVTIDSGNTVNIAPMKLYVKTATNEVVKVETESSFQKTFTSTYPYLVANYSWIVDEAQYCLFEFKDTVATNDVVLCKGIFDDTTLDSIDYSEKSYGSQIESAVPDGITPMIIISTEKVENLNVDQVDGYDAGNDSENIPISNGTICTNLNAELFAGASLDTDETLSGDSDTLVPTEKAVKAYVDALDLDGTDEISLITNGYVNFKSGLQIRWGNGTSSQDAAQTFTYALSFSNGSISIVNSLKTEDVKGLSTSAMSATGFTIDRGDSIDANLTFRYIAIGY